MKTQNVIAAIAFVLVGMSQAHAGMPSCNMQDKAYEGPRYSALACEAMNAYEAGDYVLAAARFEAALAVHHYESPNFELLPWLAIAHARAGNIEAALHALEIARNAAALLRGELVCVETDTGFHLAAREGNKMASMRAAVGYDVATRMCGGAYEAMYALDQKEMGEYAGEFFGMLQSVEQEFRQLQIVRQ